MDPYGSRNALVVSISRNGLPGSSQRFVDAEISIGRSSRCDVILDDPLVSWRHAVVQVDPVRGIVFADRSSNGSFREGRRIDEEVLGTGGVVSIPPYDLNLALQPRIDDDDSEEEETYARTSLLTAPPSSVRTAPFAETPLALRDQTPGTDEDVIGQLHVIQAPDSLLGQVFELRRRPTTIGRGDDCDITLPQRSVSRQHAVLSPGRPGRWKVEDSGSRNGIEVNGELVGQAEVTFGDKIGIGTEIIVILQRPSTSGVERQPHIDPPTVHAGMEGLACRSTPSRLDSRVTVLHVVGRVDGYSYGQLREEFARLADQGRRWFVTDLSQCSFCDHAGLGVLVNVQATLSGGRGGLCVIGAGAALQDAFRLLRLDQVLPTAPDERTAIRDLTRLMDSGGR